MNKIFCYFILFLLLISKNTFPSPYVEGVINCVEPNVKDCINSNDIKVYTQSVCPQNYVRCGNKKISSEIYNNTESKNYKNIKQNFNPNWNTYQICNNICTNGKRSQLDKSCYHNCLKDNGLAR